MKIHWTGHALCRMKIFIRIIVWLPRCVCRFSANWNTWVQTFSVVLAKCALVIYPLHPVPDSHLFLYCSCLFSDWPSALISSWVGLLPTPCVRLNLPIDLWLILCIYGEANIPFPDLRPLEIIKNDRQLDSRRPFKVWS